MNKQILKQEAFVKVECINELPTENDRYIMRLDDQSTWQSGLWDIESKSFELENGYFIESLIYVQWLKPETMGVCQKCNKAHLITVCPVCEIHPRPIGSNPLKFAPGPAPEVESDREEYPPNTCETIQT